jgi:hypothetical protein
MATNRFSSLSRVNLINIEKKYGNNFHSSVRESVFTNPENGGQIEASLNWFFLVTALRLVGYESFPQKNNQNMQQKNASLSLSFIN